MKKSRTNDLVAGYSVNTKDPMSQRVAHFMDWSAKHHPGHYVPYNLILKAVMGYAKTPRLDSDEVERLRGKMQNVRKILLEKYSRTLDSQAGVGVRATTGSADVLVQALPKKMRQLLSAKNGVMQVAGLVDASQLPNTPEMKPWKEWLSRSVADVRKVIGSAEFERKLMPPATEG